LKKTPWGDYYTSLFNKRIDPTCYCSDKLKTIFCLVSRNANTSIILSGMHADGKEGLENYSNEKLVWHDKELIDYCQKYNKLLPLSQVKIENFEKFVIVLDDPIKRYIRTLNKIYNDSSLIYLIGDFKNEENLSRFIDECLYYSVLCERDKDFLWERHLGLQKTYFDKCKEKKVEWEIVKLENLPKWWEETYNSKWLRNNVMGENKKIIVKDKFSQKQWEKMLNYLDKDIKFWKEINL
jgi:hypothetical protein